MHHQKRMFVVLMAAIVVLGCAVAVAANGPDGRVSHQAGPSISPRRQ